MAMMPRCCCQELASSTSAGLMTARIRFFLSSSKKKFHATIAAGGISARTDRMYFQESPATNSMLAKMVAMTSTVPSSPCRWMMAQGMAPCSKSPSSCFGRLRFSFTRERW